MGEVIFNGTRWIFSSPTIGSMTEIEASGVLPFPLTRQDYSYTDLDGNSLFIEDILIACRSIFLALLLFFVLFIAKYSFLNKGGNVLRKKEEA